ncbi:integrin alpha-D isoform X2 [Cuculus canorus]|uniref:integrin alpha-D isoform X2 n=1 Tax=Cuculus canorus TaxID=55661 RepID=UPI0023AAB52D|nr:integrin alpha-D isoform X2 [Cuculus canorus]
MGPRGLLLTLLSAGLTLAFDTETPIVFSGDADGAFGAAVGAFVSSDGGGVLVGAPRHRRGADGMGRIHWCRRSSGTCREVPVGGAEGAANASLGLTMAVGDHGALVCGPTLSQTCGENIYVSGFCVLLDTDFQELQRFPTFQPQCPQRPSDIVFLIDGSGSIKAEEFVKMKTFVVEVMKRFRGTDTQFALTQFSHLVVHHFDFHAFRRSRDPTLLLAEVHQLGRTTRTATAIADVLTRTFTAAAGGREDALKVLIVITDGQKFRDDRRYEDVIPLAEKMDVTRYAIGIGRSFSTPEALQELLTISSKPSQDFVFRVDNFEALHGIQEQLHHKIFSVEGTRQVHGSSFQLEMSQEGFSATFAPEGPLVGAVGAYDWAGGAWLYGAGGDRTWLNVSNGGHDVDNSYLGFAVESLSVDGHRAVALGAPRYGHRGRLVLLQRRGDSWDLLGDALGPQVGGAFGSSLCAVDTDGDGSAEVILVGTPFFYGGGSGGRVDLCDLHPEAPRLRCGRVLRGAPGHLLGGFGATVAKVGDVDGDRWPEVAIGAPLEDNESGAVYIFRGRWDGVHLNYIQRISGHRFSVRHFGRALSGGRDLTEDLLPDVAVGAEGRVLLLRSRPRLRVAATVTFQPPEVLEATGRCPQEDTTLREVSKVHICFEGTKATNDTYGSELSVSLPFRATLDPGRASSRAVFVGVGGTLIGTERVALGRRCRVVSVAVVGCPREVTTPVKLLLSYGQREPRDGQTVVIVPSGQTDVSATLRLSKGSARECETALRPSVTLGGSSPLVVGVDEALEVTVGILNRCHDDREATVRLLHSSHLALRRARLLQASGSSGSLRCRSEEAMGRQRSTVCLLDRDGFRAGTEATFALSLSVPPEAEVGTELELVATASSPPNSTTFVPAPSGVPAVPLSHHYELQIRGSRGPPLNVSFRIPSAVGGTPIWGDLGVTPQQPELVQCREGPEHPEDPNAERDRTPLDCATAACRELLCSVPALQPPQTLGFRLEGSLTLGWFQGPRIVLQSSALVAFDEGRYRNSAGSGRLEVQTLLERPEPPQPLPHILGGAAVGLLLLGLGGAGLWRAGFFRRHYRELLEGGAQGEPQE